MKPRHSKSLDSNHLAICRFLRQHGIEVNDFAGMGRVPDVQIFHGIARWMEIKTESRKANFKAIQLDYVANTKMPVAFITNEQDALDYAMTGKGELTQKQKDSIAGLLLRNPGKEQFTVRQIEATLEIEEKIAKGTAMTIKDLDELRYGK